MKQLVFLSRVALIYNGCMFGIMITRYFNWVATSTMQSTGVVEGFILGICLNGLLTAWLIISLVNRRSGSFLTPRWLFIFNGACFIFQLYLLLK